jgi:hypothetical protein
MKKLILILIFVSGCGLIKAQTYVPFPDSNATWRTLHYIQGGCDYPDFCKYEYTINSDTIIGSYSYRKIFERSNSNYTYQYRGALRELNEKIYFRPNSCTYDILFYDFNIVPGDTIKNVPDGPFCSSSFQNELVLISIDSVLINNKYRKRYNLYDGYEGNLFWLEGIGSSHGLLNPSIPHVTCSCPYYLTCFIQEDTLLIEMNNPYSSYCYPLTSVTESILSKNNNVNIIPNPVTSSSVFKINNLNWTNSTLEIYSYSGQKIKSILIDLQTTINRSDFQRGLYIYRLITKSEIINGKFEVE